MTGKFNEYQDGISKTEPGNLCQVDPFFLSYQGAMKNVQTKCK